MFSSKSMDHLAFVSRQLSNLLIDEPLEPALRRLTQASPKQYAQDIEYLRNLLSGAPLKSSSLRPNPYETLATLLPAVSGSTNTFFRKFVEYVQQSRVVFETYWAGVVGMTWYFAALSFVALGISVIFGAFVIPSFSSVFSQIGATLPKLTATVFSFGGTGVPVLALGVTLIVGLVVWFVILFHRRIQAMAPMARWPKWVPIIGGIAESYNLGLFLNFVRMLRESDVEPSRSVEMAARAANQPASLSYEKLADSDGSFGQRPELAELAVAAKLGNFDNEIAHQCDQHLGRLSLELIEARDRFSLVLKLVLYVFVGTLIVAMYLPIFKMGSVI